MLNRVILMGRITQDLEVKTDTNGTSVLSFSVAVERSYAKQGEERQTDFINCVAWRQQAEFINRYFGKGRMIALEGNLRTRTYDDKNGSKHYVTEVFVDSVSFTGEPKQGGGIQQGSYSITVIAGRTIISNSNNQQNSYLPQYNQPPQRCNMSIGDLADLRR